LGAKVTVVEFLDQLLPGLDGDVRKEAGKIFKKQGMNMMLGHKVTGAKVDGKTVTLTIEKAAGGDEQTLEASHVLVAIGRRPNTEGLALDKARCSPTRPRMKALPWPRISRALPGS
jgi:dihydrolipoamide dehydrogenase